MVHSSTLNKRQVLSQLEEVALLDNHPHYLSLSTFSVQIKDFQDKTNQVVLFIMEATKRSSFYLTLITAVRAIMNEY